MAQGIDLGYAATLPSKEAVAYFRAKGAHISWNWFETNADVHARSFTAAKSGTPGRTDHTTGGSAACC